MRSSYIKKIINFINIFKNIFIIIKYRAYYQIAYILHISKTNEMKANYCKVYFIFAFKEKSIKNSKNNSKNNEIYLRKHNSKIDNIQICTK